MTSEEAIEALRLEGEIDITGKPKRIAEFFEALDMAIEALKEVQQYREIGTVEECRKAVEKQKAKEPKLKYKPRFLGKTTYTCPNCGNCCLEEFANERQRNNYCWDCGQKLDWDENLEGMEDENT